MSQFNNKLLAFKWCYDRNYKPDWNNPDESKYLVYYDCNKQAYDYTIYAIIRYTTLCFSTKEVAQKCCDWLNSERNRGVTCET